VRPGESPMPAPRLSFAGQTLTRMDESELLSADGGVAYSDGFVCDGCERHFMPGGGWTIFHGDGGHGMSREETLVSGGSDAALDLCTVCAAAPKVAEKRLLKATAAARGPPPKPKPKPKPTGNHRGIGPKRVKIRKKTAKVQPYGNSLGCSHGHGMQILHSSLAQGSVRGVSLGQYVARIPYAYAREWLADAI
jgi:hypothetical protein